MASDKFSNLYDPTSSFRKWGLQYLLHRVIVGM